MTHSSSGAECLTSMPSKWEIGLRITTPMPGWGWVLQYRTTQAMKTLSSMEEGDLGGLPRPTVSLPNSRSRRLRFGKNCQCFLWENARLSSETFPHPRERQANTRPSENRARLGNGTLSKLWVPGAETTNQQHDMFKTAQHTPSLTEMLGGGGSPEDKGPIPREMQLRFNMVLGQKSMF